MKKVILIITSFLLLSVNAQEDYKNSGLYTAIGYAYGFPKVNLSNTNDTFVEFNNNNNNHTALIELLYKTPLKAELKIGYAYSYNIFNFKGNTNNGTFDISNYMHSHAMYLGAGYNFILRPQLELNLGLGSLVSFIKKDNILYAITNKEGELEHTNRSIKGGNVYIVPQIAVNKYFDNGNFLTFGMKYLYSANDDFVYGYVSTKIKAVHRQINFTSNINQIALYLTYNFNLKL